MLFMLEYQINHSQKMDAFGAFASMSPDDDAAIEAAHGYRRDWPLARHSQWCGVAIVEAESSEALHGSLMMWAGMAETLSITPVLDDAGARAVISANLSS